MPSSSSPSPLHSPRKPFLRASVPLRVSVVDERIACANLYTAPMKSLGTGLFSTVLLVLGTGLFSTAQVTPFDIVLENARIIDGTGAPSRTGDVGIRDGRIASIGRLAGQPAKERLNLGGLALAPGFIDVHTHADDVASRPLAENFIHMGVTSIVAGNCGSSALDRWATRSRASARQPSR